MKLFYKLLIMLLLSACIAPLFIKGPDNKPLMTLEKLKLLKFSIQQLPKLTALKRPAVGAKEDTAITVSAEKIKIFKWKDDDGIWHFSDHKNPGGYSEILYLPAGDNVAGSNDSIDSINQLQTSIQKHLAEIHAKLPSAKTHLTTPFTDAVQLKNEAQRVKKQIEDKYGKQGFLLK